MNQFENCDSRELFQKVNRISKPSSAGVLPSTNDSDEQLAECFSKFFAERIEKIASEFNSSNLMFDDCSNVTPSSCHSVFEKFSAVSVQQVLSLISRSSSSSSILDPVPTSLLKKMC